MSLEAENLVTEEELKRISREFCLESIFILDLSCRGICALGPVCKCLNVCVLDLSSNNLSSVGDLVVLTALEHLDLSNNCISQLDGLQKLENLSRLELAGNKISSFETLLPLSSLCKLEHLTLQQCNSAKSSAKLSNPICADTTYAAAMAETFPALTWLDGELVKDGMPGKRFYDKYRSIESSCSQIEDAKQLSDFPEVCSKDPLDLTTDHSDKHSEERIESLLEECRDTSSKVKKLLSDVKNELKQCYTQTT